MKRSLITISLLLTVLAGAAHAGNWNWQLAPDRYKLMNAFERAQYDKAAKLYTEGNYTAAAAEFEKFKVQFSDSDMIPYMLLMRGLSLHNAKNRHTAIKVYQEVLDYFGDQVEDAAPAQYWLGVAHLDNGEMIKGLRVMKGLVESDKYKTHPLAAGALRRLADNHYNNKEFPLAVKYWQQTIRDFANINDEERNNAVQNYAAYSVIAKDYKPFEAFFVSIAEDNRKEDPSYRRWIAETYYQRGIGLYTWHEGWKFRRVEIKDNALAQERKAFYEAFKSSKPWYEKNQGLWEFYEHCAVILAYLHPDKDERNKMVDEAVACIRATTGSQEAKDGMLARLIDVLREGRVFDRARFVVGLLGDRLLASYKEYELLAHEGKWDKAVEQLQGIQKSGQEKWRLRALGDEARIYKDVLGKYEQAIKLYNDLNQPPGTLFAIAECYQRWNKLDQAAKTLTEIENLFPDHASRAAWWKAAWYDAAGEKKKAIGAARRLLKAYPKSSESSHAHLLLEKYGVKAIGGGEGDEE